MTSRRYLLLGVGALLIAVALALPTMARARASTGGARWPGWSMGRGMGPGMGSAPAPIRGPVTAESAVTQVKQALAAWGYADLVPREVMEFSNHFYVVVVERDTGTGAMELIVARNGAVYPEPGPNMMWNTKYGHMGGYGATGMGHGMMGPGMGPGMMGPGMMGGYGPGGSAAPPSAGAPVLTLAQARARAQRWLNTATAGAAPDEGLAFYGYFTFDVARAGRTIGMLGVNAYSGQVWYHTWHGTFVRETHL